MHLTSLLAAAKARVVSRRQAIARAISLGLIGNQAQPGCVASDLRSMRERCRKLAVPSDPSGEIGLVVSERAAAKSPRPGPLQSPLAARTSGLISPTRPRDAALQRRERRRGLAKRWFPALVPTLQRGNASRRSSVALAWRVGRWSVQGCSHAGAWEPVV